MIAFSRYRKVYLAISIMVISMGLLSMLVWGYQFSIEFTGGTIVTYKNAQGIVKKSTQDKPPDAVTILSKEVVGPVLGREAVLKTLFACSIALAGIMLYIAYSFKKWSYALAAIIALMHDILVVLGVYSLISHFFGAQFDMLFITALLTTMSFSVHDTIVICDRIRELSRRGQGGATLVQRADTAVSETLVRSINNSLTIFFMLLSLVVLGGSTTRFFASALLVGTITGAYSSPFVATPVLVWLENRKKLHR